MIATVEWHTASKKYRTCDY